MADLTPEQLEEVRAYAEAFRQEFESSLDEDDTIDKKVKDIEAEFDKLTPLALGALNHVLKHSLNESLKVNVSKWLIDKQIERRKAINDPLVKLLDEMKNLPTSEATKT